MKALVIVDVQTLFLSARSDYGPQARVDYMKLSETINEMYKGAEVTKLAYILASPLHDDKKFINFLKKLGFVIMRKFAEIDNTQDTEEGIQFKNRSWAGAMAWDTLSTLPYYDKICIISGNGLFCPVVDSARLSGKHVTVMSFPTVLQKELAKKADAVIYLTDNDLFHPKLKEIPDVTNSEN